MTPFDSTNVYIVMNLRVWANQKLEPSTLFQLSIAPTMADGSFAFLPVFRSREEAEREYPDMNILEARFLKSEVHP